MIHVIREESGDSMSFGEVFSSTVSIVELV